MNQPDAVILGGGLAGISCALRLAREGLRVELIETRPRLGGRATSFTDPRSGETLDNCQHIAMGCCTNYLSLLDDLGVADLLRWDREQTWLEPGGRATTIRPCAVPAPGHFFRSFLGASFLAASDKAGIARAMLALLRTDPAVWRGRVFADFLDAHRQPAGARGRFWEPVVVSACNLPCARVAATAAMQVFREGFLGSARAAEIGVATVPLVRLYDAAEAAVQRAGGRVRLRSSVMGFDERRVRLHGGETVEAGRVVCALPCERAAIAASERTRAEDPRFERWARLSHSPIVGVHVEFDRPVLAVPHAVLLDCGTQWVFRKDEAGKKIHAVISAAEEWVGLEEAETVERVRADVVRCIPEAEGARVVRARAVKEKRATFAATPESEELRPPAERPGGGGVVLAGDSTRTGWPATMEGATRSGFAAAAAVLGVPARTMLTPDLPPAGASRWLLRPGRAVLEETA